MQLRALKYVLPSLNFALWGYKKVLELRCDIKPVHWTVLFVGAIPMKIGKIIYNDLLHRYSSTAIIFSAVPTTFITPPPTRPN
jgi:hypothetical protein